MDGWINESIAISVIYFETDEEIKIENEKLEKVESYNYLGQITTTNRKSEDEIKERIRKSWSCFGKNREMFMDNNLPLTGF